ncbi:MAG: class III extradiol ring-cleavage dioxygenase [Pseudomonadota bacterium]
MLLGAHPARQFWRDLGRRMPTPSAVVVVSAHHKHPYVQVSADPSPATVHDFVGFPAVLGETVYPAPGAPELALKLSEAISRAHPALPVRAVARRGLDHGAWVPLLELLPRADVPVVQVSLLTDGADPRLLPERHLGLGAVLGAALPDGVLLIGSGSLTHAVPERSQTGCTPGWVQDFRQWLHEAIAREDIDTLLAYRSYAPYAARNHPTPEHLMPLFVLLGTFGIAGARPLHESVMHDVLAMDAYGWD